MVFVHMNIVNAAEQLGLPLIPPYSEASTDQMLHGVNYASAAAGILDITGRNFVSIYLYYIVLYIKSILLSYFLFSIFFIKEIAYNEIQTFVLEH